MSLKYEPASEQQKPLFKLREELRIQQKKVPKDNPKP